MASLSDFAHTIFSYNTNVMLAALISLLLVVLFVLLLHAYANCFFPRPRPRPTALTVSYVLAPPRLHPLPFDSASSAPSKGLHPSLISAIPLFVYESDHKNKSATAMDCVICLSEFQDRDIGRRLRNCGHGFHIQCIDMWLDSHASCPVCRAPVVADAAAESEGDVGGGGGLEERNHCESQRDNDNEEQNGEFHSSDSASSSSSSSSIDPPLMSLVASLKRIMSRNRTEGRIFPSSNAHQFDV